MRVDEMTYRYPQLKFVMAHMGLGTDNKLAIDFYIREKSLETLIFQAFLIVGATGFEPATSASRTLFVCEVYYFLSLIL